MQGMSQKRYLYIDFMKAIAILLVLVIHTSTIYAKSSHDYLIGNWLASIAEPCIGIFLFVSGYLFKFSPDKKTLRYYVKKTAYLLIPYTIFFLAFIIIYLYSDNQISNLKSLLFWYFTASRPFVFYYVFVIFWLTTLAYFLTNC